jgi:hypothetical protein
MERLEKLEEHAVFRADSANDCQQCEADGTCHDAPHYPRAVGA